MKFKSGKREDLGGKFFRSKWEANWARYLEWMRSRGEIISWEYEVQTFEFVKIKRGSRFYTPDFKVVEKNGIVFHEVKGFMDDRSRVKLKRMGIYYPKVRILLVDKKLYLPMAREMRHLLPGFEQ